MSVGLYVSNLASEVADAELFDIFDAPRWRSQSRRQDMGDKSPKSKQRSQKQKVAATIKGMAVAEAKQDAYSQTARSAAKVAPKGKR